MNSKLLYISPSVFPSQAANTTHVVLQTEALSKLYKNVRVVGLASPNEKEKSKIKEKIAYSYGINAKNIEFSFCRSIFGVAENLIIAIYSIYFMLTLKDHDVITRNIYAAFFLLIFTNDDFIYETHTIESSFRQYLQKILLKSKRVNTIVISKSLGNLLNEKYNVSKYKMHVQHDAARSGLDNLMYEQESNKELLPIKNNYDLKIGYFGSLLSGRGIEIIEEISRKMPNNIFLVYGPKNQNNEFEERAKNIESNIFFGGFLGHKDIHKNMMNCDILLMPYQKKVSIDKKGSDTSRWMSPMKMFEYMAAGKPIISSDLPVLREVLSDGINALMVEPDNSDAWVSAIKMIQSDKNFTQKLSFNARQDYINKYNWLSRAKSIKNIFNQYH